MHSTVQQPRLVSLFYSFNMKHVLMEFKAWMKQFPVKKKPHSRARPLQYRSLGETYTHRVVDPARLTDQCSFSTRTGVEPLPHFTFLQSFHSYTGVECVTILLPCDRSLHKQGGPFPSYCLVLFLNKHQGRSGIFYFPVIIPCKHRMDLSRLCYHVFIQWVTVKHYRFYLQPVLYSLRGAVKVEVY